MFGCSPKNLSRCNETAEENYIMQRAKKIANYYYVSHRVGYSVMGPICAVGFIFNFYIAGLLIRLWRQRKIQWKHFPVVLTVVIVDIAGSGLMVSDAVIHLTLVKNYEKFLGKYAPLSIASFVWAFLVPALGYAIQGILQTIAVTKPFNYTKSFDTTKAWVIAALYVVASISITGSIAGSAAKYFGQLAAKPTDQEMYESLTSMGITVVAMYAVLMTVFTLCNMKITYVLWKSSSSVGSATPTKEVKLASLIRIHILLHTIVGVSFVVTHGVCIHYIRQILKSTKMENTCTRCFKLYDIKQRNQLTQLLTWLFKVSWSARYIIEPSVMLGQKEVRKAVRRQIRTLSSTLSLSSSTRHRNKTRSTGGTHSSKGQSK